MKKKYHHLANGTFRNPEGSKVIDMNFNWSFKVFNKEKKKLDMTFPESNIIKREKVLLVSVKLLFDQWTDGKKVIFKF